jgi:hypothetical protein
LFSVSIHTCLFGCWEEIDYDDCDDETRTWLENFFEEGNSYYDLEEEEGWVQGDCEMIIDCDPIFERVDGPDANKRYDVDGDEIKEEEKEPVGESVKLNPNAVWPFPNSEE